MKTLLKCSKVPKYYVQDCSTKINTKTVIVSAEQLEVTALRSYIAHWKKNLGSRGELFLSSGT